MINQKKQNIHKPPLSDSRSPHTSYKTYKIRFKRLSGFTVAVCPPVEKYPVLWLNLTHPPLQFILHQLKQQETAHALSELVQIL